MADTTSGARNRKYEPPILCPLGELAKGTGQNCQSGTNVGGGNCKDGTAPQANCTAGNGGK